MNDEPEHSESNNIRIRHLSTSANQPEHLLAHLTPFKSISQPDSEPPFSTPILLIIALEFDTASPTSPPPHPVHQAPVYKLPHHLIETSSIPDLHDSNIPQAFQCLRENVSQCVTLAKIRDFAIRGVAAVGARGDDGKCFEVEIGVAKRHALPGLVQGAEVRDPRCKRDMPERAYFRVAEC